MDKRITSMLVGLLIGAFALGACTQNLAWGGAGAVIGALGGLIVGVSLLKMEKDRETGLDS